MTNQNLQSLRKQIDQCDAVLIKTLAYRFSLVKDIGDIKKKEGMPPFDRSRHDELLDNVSKVAEYEGISKDMVIKIFEVIHDFSVLHQA